MGIERTALIVEDDKMLQIGQKIVIQGQGFSVNIASDGKKAIEQVRKNQYDFIFMDFGLPDIDGSEVARKIRDIEALESRKASVIIAVTAHAYIDKGEICRVAGMDSYIQKPLSVDKLLQVIEKRYSGFIEILDEN